MHTCLPSSHKEQSPVDYPSLLHSANWDQEFKIPEVCAFSSAVQRALESGVISSKARREIVQVLRTLILQHTRLPTSRQYSSVCYRLITVYPKLRDEAGCGYVSISSHTYGVHRIPRCTVKTIVCLAHLVSVVCQHTCAQNCAGHNFLSIGYEQHILFPSREVLVCLIHTVQSVVYIQNVLYIPSVLDTP